LRGLNGLAGKDVRVIAVEEVAPDWEARSNARGKWYCYLLLPRVAGPALQEGRVWHIRPDLDVERLRRELATLPATAHWGAYRASDCSSPDPTKTLHAAEVETRARGVVALRFHGSGFLKQMVRILVGTAVEVGRGRMPEGTMVRVRETQKRSEAGPTAPPQGLYLERVLYEAD
jgi:tRNA pseudouridine38-40 synthase